LGNTENKTEKCNGHVGQRSNAGECARIVTQCIHILTWYMLKITYMTVAGDFGVISGKCNVEELCSNRNCVQKLINKLLDY